MTRRFDFNDFIDVDVLKDPTVGSSKSFKYLQGRKLSMFIVLPDDVDGLPALEAKLSENLNFMNQVDQYPMVNKLHVAIPKFKVEGDVQMKQLLIELGMGDSFDENVADFSGMSGKKDLYISQVFHKSFIEVNEEGSEAAAATG